MLIEIILKISDEGFFELLIKFITQKDFITKFSCLFLYEILIINWIYMNEDKKKDQLKKDQEQSEADSEEDENNFNMMHVIIEC
jgi:hypothetical protein